MGSSEYSGNPIAGDFSHARKSSPSASFSIVIAVLRHDNNLEGYSFKLTRAGAIRRRNLIHALSDQFSQLASGA
jgi:hypothetical protein